MKARIHTGAKKTSMPVRKQKGALWLQRQYSGQIQPETASLAHEEHLNMVEQPNSASSSLASFPRAHHFGRMGIWHAGSASMQPKLAIGQPNDHYEQEADHVAEQVMRMAEPGSIALHSIEPVAPLSIQRICTECEKELQRRPTEGEEKEEETLQTKTASSEPPILSANIHKQITALQSGGQPLLQAERAFFEPRFGVDFSKVRIHANDGAAKTARAINARAFTLGQHIVFGAGRYGSSSAEGQRLLAHELTHVVQQGAVVPANRQDGARSGNQNLPININRSKHTDANGLLQRAVTGLAVAGAAAEATHANHFVVARGAGPVIATATVSAPGQAVNWTGGRPRPGNNLERVIPATSARTVAITANTPADPGPQSVTVHVVNGRTAPANTLAPLNFSRQPGNPPGFPAAGLFGLTDIRVNNPTARIRAFLVGNQWAFQVDRISHRFQLGVNSANTNIPSATSATNANHCQVITDLTPPAVGAASGPPRANFWSRPITEAHEFAHVARFYSPPFWQAFMRTAEANIEAAASNVNVDHTVPATLTDRGVVIANAAAHQAIINAQHAAADAAEFVGTEIFAHDQSNPRYATLVAQIAARFRPLAPTALAAVALGPASVRLNWTDNACNATEYRVYRRGPRGGFVRIATLAAGAVTFTDTSPGMATATNFIYHVTAAGVAGESNRSNRVAITTP